MQHNINQKTFNDINIIWDDLDDLQRLVFLQNNPHIKLVVQLHDNIVTVTHPDIVDKFLKFDDSSKLDLTTFISL